MSVKRAASATRRAADKLSQRVLARERGQAANGSPGLAEGEFGNGRMRRFAEASL